MKKQPNISHQEIKKSPNSVTLLGVKSQTSKDVNVYLDKSVSRIN